MVVYADDVVLLITAKFLSTISELMESVLLKIELNRTVWEKIRQN